MEATEIMTGRVHYVSPNDSIAHVKKLFLKHKISTVLVMDGKKPVGLVGEPDVATAFFHARSPVDEVPVKEVMNKKITKVEPEATPSQIARTLLAEKAKGVIVFDEEEGVLGLVTKTDLLDYFISHCPGEIKVKDVMDTNIRTIRPRHSLFHAIRTMREEGIGRILVVEDGLKGILTMKDVAFVSPKAHPTRLLFKKPGSEPTEREYHIMPFTVEDVMRTDVEKISTEAAASKAAKTMMTKGIGSLVVVDEKGAIAGMITKTDIAKYLSKSI